MYLQVKAVSKQAKIAESLKIRGLAAQVGSFWSCSSPKSFLKNQIPSFFKKLGI